MLRAGRATAGSHGPLQPDDRHRGSGADAASQQPNASSSGLGSSGSNGASAPSAFAKFKRFMVGDKADVRAKLAELGFGGFAAYGVVSNMNAGVIMTISWLSIARKYGASPLEQGLWPQFLLAYAGLYVASNFLRPFRLGGALAAAPFVNGFLEALQRRTGCNKAVAFGLLLAMIAVSSFTLIFGTITALGGFPNGPPPLPRMPWQAAA